MPDSEQQVLQPLELCKGVMFQKLEPNGGARPDPFKVRRHRGCKLTGCLPQGYQIMEILLLENRVSGSRALVDYTRIKGPKGGELRCQALCLLIARCDPTVTFVVLSQSVSGSTRTRCCASSQLVLIARVQARATRRAGRLC